MSKSIEFATAKLAKEKGFDVPCRGHIHCSHYHLVKNNIIPRDVPTHDKEMFAPIKDWNNYLKPALDTNTSLPTQEELSIWLREKHRIHVSANPWKDEGGYGITTLPEEGFQVLYEGNVVDVNDDWAITTTSSFCKSHEDCLEAALVEGLKLIE